MNLSHNTKKKLPANCFSNISKATVTSKNIIINFNFHVTPTRIIEPWTVIDKGINTSFNKCNTSLSIRKKHTVNKNRFISNKKNEKKATTQS